MESIENHAYHENQLLISLYTIEVIIIIINKAGIKLLQN